MKTKILLLIFFIYTQTITGQNWVNSHNFATGESITQFNFLNANTGYVTTRNGNTIKIWKTINKGNTWAEIKTFAHYPFSGNASTFLVFTNVNTGYFAYVPTDRARTIIEKTIDGGSYWERKVDHSAIPLTEHPLLAFINENEGYLFATEETNPSEVRVFKTENGFDTFTHIHTETPGYQISYHINDMLKDGNNLICIGWNNRGPGYQYTDAFRISYYGNFTPHFGTENTHVKYLYGTIANSTLKYVGVQEQTFNTYPGTRFYPDFANQETSVQIDPQTSTTKVGGLSFSDNNKGFVLIGNKVYLTNNGGNAWSIDGNFSTEVNTYRSHQMLKSFGDVVYAGTAQGKFHIREIAGNYNTNFDWQGGNGSIAIDGVNISTPGNGYFRGGITALYANQYLLNGTDTAYRFYYWGGNCNGSMSYGTNSELLISGSNINADYKTKLKSTTAEALKNANQVKILKDTNGVTNLIYESMGGIFFTRTKNANGDFKREEILSGTASAGYVNYNNTNPYLSEIKWYSNDPSVWEKNVVACWEQREGNNIKIYDAFRTQTLPEWPWINSVRYTIENAPTGFQAFPKVFTMYTNDYLEVITYLKPEGNQKKLMARVYKGPEFKNEFELIGASDIQEYAIASITNNIGYEKFFNLNIAYRTGQSISYKRVEIGMNIGSNNYFANTIVTEPNISLDNSRWRASLDISLKNTANSTNAYNMQPVITYQGRYDVRVMIDNEDGPPIEQAGAYYPIYVKERLSAGNWSSSNISYNSPINTVQMTPNIEGSKHMNSCILDYARGSAAPFTHYKVVPRWNGALNSGFGCNPTTYTGTDAKFIKGGLINNSSTSHKLMTLSLPENNVYTVGTQNFTITNGSEGDGSFDAISGSVESNDVQYTFNLGNILVNSNNIGFLNDIDTTIEDSGELNENMVSETFSLNENDTLIIGRNAAYVLNDPNGAPVEIEYWVRLMNKTKNSEHRLLVHDTLRAVDSVLYEYLEGYIIRDIEGGTDSFYVQLEIDTVDGNFGIGGGLGGDGDGGGDASNTIKKKIFWENENLTVKGNTLPTEFALYQNFPNPFNPATVIKYDLPKDVKVTVKIYDLLGREVVALVNNEFKNAGRYELNWNAGKYASGVYIYRIEAGDYISTKKMILVK